MRANAQRAAEALQAELISIVQSAPQGLELKAIHAQSKIAEDLQETAREMNRLLSTGQVLKHINAEKESRYFVPDTTKPTPSPTPPEPAPIPACPGALLRAAAKAIDDRADQRDCPGGERSMVRAVLLFNALTGHTLSELDGWQFMCCLKLSRSRAGRFVEDDYTDCAAYVALAAEAAAKAGDLR